MEPETGVLPLGESETFHFLPSTLESRWNLNRWWIGTDQGEDIPGEGELDGVWFMQRLMETVILVVSLLFLGKLCRGRASRKEEDPNHNLSGNNKIVLRRVSHFPVRIPYLDGGITLFKLRKYGVKILEKWANTWGSRGGFVIEAGPELVHAITDASIAQKILNSTDPGHLGKPKKLYNKIFVEWLNGGLVNSPYETWSVHRRILTRAFSYGGLRTFLKVIMNVHAKNLAKDLIKHSEDDGVLEGQKMYDLIYFHTIKIISQILMGNQSCSDEESTEFHKNLEKYKHTILYRFLHPELFIETLWKLHPKKREADWLVKWCNEFTMKIINDFKAKLAIEQGPEVDVPPKEEDNVEEDGNQSKNDDHDDGIKPLRCCIEEMIYSGMSDKEMLNEVGTFMSAGHETTAMALQMLMFNLALNPVHQSRCHEEVDALFNSKVVSSDFDHDLDVDDLTGGLKYLERCILESGRITPTVPIFARKLETPLRINEELELPAETTAILLPWAMHRDPKHYPNPEIFDPDRFLPEEVKKRHPAAYLAFSGGPRNCIGWKVAVMEIKVIMTWILRYFEIHTTDGPTDVKLFFDVTLAPERNHNIILKRRKSICHSD